MSERIEPGAEAAHRDDLARDVAQLWSVKDDLSVEVRGCLVPVGLIEALNRLGEAYGEDK